MTKDQLTKGQIMLTFIESIQKRIELLEGLLSTSKKARFQWQVKLTNTDDKIAAKGDQIERYSRSAIGELIFNPGDAVEVLSDELERLQGIKAETLEKFKAL